MKSLSDIAHLESIARGVVRRRQAEAGKFQDPCGRFDALQGAVELGAILDRREVSEAQRKLLKLRQQFNPGGQL